MPTPSEPTGPDAPPSVEQIWKDIVEDRITKETAAAMYRRLAGDDADANLEDLDILELWRWEAQLDQEVAFVNAVMEIATRKIPEEKIALALLLEDGGIDKAAARYEKVAYADRDAWADRFRTKAALFAVVKPSAAILAYARVIALEPDDIDTLLTLARLLHRTDNALAVGWYQRLIDHPKIEPSTRAEALGELAAFEERQGHLEKAFSLHEQAFDLQTDLGGMLPAHGHISWMVAHVKAQGNDALEERLSKGLVILELALDRPEDAAVTFSNMGLLAFNRSDWAVAEDRFRRALDLFKRCEDTLGMVFVLKNLSAIEARRGAYRAAEKLLKKALALGKQIDARKQILDVLLRLSSTAEEQEHFRRTKAHLREALALANAWSDTAALALFHEELAAFADRRDEDAEAANHEKLASEHYERAGDAEKAAYMSLSLGNRLCKADDFGRAAVRYERARVLYQRAGHQRGVAVAEYQLALIDMQEKEWGSAEIRLGRALALFTQVDDQERVAETSMRLGYLVASRGDIDGARDHWGRALTRYTNVGKRNSPEAQGVMEVLRKTMPK